MHADGVVVIVRYGKTTKSQLASAVQSLRAVDARIMGAVINMAPLKGSDAAMRYDGYGYYQDDAGPPANAMRRCPSWISSSVTLRAAFTSSGKTQSFASFTFIQTAGA